MPRDKTYVTKASHISKTSTSSPCCHFYNVVMIIMYVLLLDSCRLFFYTLQVSIMRVSYFLIPSRNECLTNLCYQYHSGLYTIQEPSHLGKIAQVPIWFRMLLTPIITRVYKDSLTLTYPPNINIWLILQL